MDNKALYAILAVAVIIVAGAAVALTVGNGGNGGNNGENAPTYDESGVRLRIYGNANGDDVIDSKDVDVIKQIIKNNDSEWKKEYYFADADHDGKITDNDVTVTEKIIKGEKTKMWYESAFSTKDKIGKNDHIDAFVNYPIGHKVGCEYSDVDILGVLGVYDYFSATSKTAQNDYGDSLYPGISTKPVLGDKDELTMEGIAALVDNGTIDTLIQWTGGTSKNYIWDAAEKAGLTEKLSIVMVTIQGEHCINGVLMLACMFGDQNLSKAYADWYASAMTTLGKITDDVKKTCLVIKAFNPDTIANVSAYKQYQSPALWFSKIVNFTPETSGTTGFLTLGSPEAISAAAKGTDFVIIQTKHTKPTNTQEKYNTWCDAKMQDLFANASFDPENPEAKSIYDLHAVYSIDFSLMPFMGGPAACLLLASQIYGDSVISFEDASALVNDYCTKFMPAGSATAGGMSWGYTYTGWRTA